MKITVYQGKGGVGKTPIATNIALDREYAIGTNEAFHVYDSFIPDERLVALDLTESFPSFPNEIDVVFDLAGAISKESHSITSAICQSDLVIIPIENNVKSLASGIGTIEEIYDLEDFTGKCLIVATKLVKGRKEHFGRKEWDKSNDFKNIQKAIKESEGDLEIHLPIKPLKLSNAFETIFEKERSIAQLCASDPLLNYHYRDVEAQFDEIYQYIDEVQHAIEK